MWVTSSCKFGRIISYILYLLPNRGIWRIKHEGTCKKNTIKIWVLFTIPIHSVLGRCRELRPQNSYNSHKLDQRRSIEKALENGTFSGNNSEKKNGCKKWLELIKLIGLSILDHCFEVLWEKDNFFHQASVTFFTHILSNHQRVQWSQTWHYQLNTLSISGVRFVARRGHFIVTLRFTPRISNPFTKN